jgi:hypothetical protein
MAAGPAPSSSSLPCVVLPPHAPAHPQRPPQPLRWIVSLDAGGPRSERLVDVDVVVDVRADAGP